MDTREYSIGELGEALHQRIADLSALGLISAPTEEFGSILDQWLDQWYGPARGLSARTA
jgi:hypothetical protein